MAKIRLVEKILVSIPKENIEVYEKPILFESEGKVERKLGKLKDVPVTKYTENLNERVYPRELWEHVMESGAFTGSPCRTDHPEESDGSVKDICGIWSNFRVKESVAIADLTVIGNYGANMLDIVSAGGKLGFSTVGMGDFKEDQKTVDPTTYAYEACDWVMTPSQGVYATYENLTESTEKIGVNFKESITNSNVDNNEKVEVLKMDKIFEASVKNQVTRLIKESKKAENISEAIDDLNKFVVPDTMLEEKIAIQNAVSDLQVKLDESKKLVESKLVKTSESFADLEKKYSIQSKMIESMKNKFNKVDAVLKAEGLESIKDITTLKKSITEALEDIKVLTAERADMLKDLNHLYKERVLMLKDLKEFMKGEKLTEAKKEEASKAIKEAKKLADQLAFAEKHVAKLEKQLKKLGFKFEATETDGTTDEEDEDEDKKEESKKSKKEAVPKVADFSRIKKEAEGEDEDEDEDEDDEKKESRRRVKIAGLTEADEKDDEEVDEDDSDDEKMAKLRAKKEAKEDGDEEDGEDKEDEDEEEEKKEAVKKSKKPVKEAEEDEEDEDEDEDEEDDKEDKKEERYLKKELTNLFKEQVKSFPGIKDFEKQITGSKSFTEAVKKIDRIKEKREDLVQSGGSIGGSGSWIPEGRI